MENLSLLKINIKKRTLSESLILFIVFFPFVQAALTEMFRIPDVIKFFVDVSLVLLATKIILQRRLTLNRNILPFSLLIIGLFVYTFVGYLFNYQSIFYYIWGLRNNFRFFVAFIVFCLLVDWDDAKRWLKVLDWLYIINLFTVIIQYFGGYSQDFLGGIFGTQRGCNGSLLVFLSIVVCKSVLGFLRGEESTIKSISIVVSSMVIAALAELKFYLIIFIIIALMATLMTRSSFRKTIILFFGFLCVVVFSTILSMLYNEFAGFLSVENLLAAIKNPNYGSSEDIGRFTAIPMVVNNFMTGITDILFGLGLGNCDSSSISLFNSPFYASYYAYHYNYFSYAMWFLETGVIGLIGYASFFVLSFVVSLKNHLQGIGDSLASQMAMIIAAICCILLVYNVSLRSEISYLLFFILSLPLISSRKVHSDINSVSELDM